MGEYADDLIDGDMGHYLDERFGECEDNEDNGCVDCEIRFTPKKKEVEPIFDILEFKEIITESDKAWKLRMSGDAETWFSKNIVKSKEIL